MAKHLDEQVEGVPLRTAPGVWPSSATSPPAD